MARILLVDDEKGIRNSFKEFFSLEGHFVTLAGDVAEAMAILSKERFDIAVTDLILPGQSGMELVRTLRRTQPETQVVILTGEPTVQTAVEAMRLGAWDYLCKPVSGDELCRIVNSAAEHKRKAEETRIALKDNQEKLKLVADNVMDVIWASDMNFNFSFVNPAVEQLTGYSVEELLSCKENFTRLIIPSERERIVALIKARLERPTMKDGKSRSYTRTETEIVRKDGRHVWIEVISTSMRDESGQPVGLMGVTRDITDRKAVEARNPLCDELLMFSRRWSKRFRVCSDWRLLVREMLSDLGKTSMADHIHLQGYQIQEDGLFLPMFEYQWEGEPDKPAKPAVDWLQIFEQERQQTIWETLQDGEAMLVDIDSMPDNLGHDLTHFGFRRLIFVPIFVGARFTGHIGLLDNLEVNRWSARELDALILAVEVLGAAMARPMLRSHEE